MPRSTCLSSFRRLFLFLTGFYCFLTGFCLGQSCDSIEIYYDNIRHSQDNAELEFWVEKALLYARECGDMQAYYEFRFRHSRLAFLQGDYASAFDSLAGLEKEIADYLHQPSILDQMWHSVTPEDFAMYGSDSLGTELHVKIGLGLAEIATYMGGFSEAVNIVTNIRTLYSRDSADAVSARCYNAMGVIFASQGLIQKGEEYFLRSLDLSSGKLPEDFVATVYANLSACYVGAGNPKAALKSAMGSYGLLMKNDLFGEQYVYALFYMGIAYVGLGEYDMAEKQFREALDEATSRAFGHLSLYIRSNLVYVLVEQGNLEEAEMLAQENLVSAIEIDNLEMQENALVYLSHIAEAHQNFYEGLQYKDSAYRVGRRLIEQNNKLRQGIICGGWNSTGNSKRWNVPSGRWPC